MGNPRQTWTASQKALARQIVQQAQADGADPLTVLADAIVESGLRPKAVGDRGTSFNLWQDHEGGALPGGAVGAKIRSGDAAAAIANDVARFKGGKGGAFAAQVQRPAGADAYAKRVDAEIKVLRAEIPTVNTSRWVKGDTTGLNADLLLRLAALGQRIGKPLTITSGFRTRAEQETLYARFLAGGTLAAKPGTSNHESGHAADVYVGSTPLSNVPGAATVAKALGLGFPVNGEAWHTEVTSAKGNTNVSFLSASPVIGGLLQGPIGPGGADNKAGVDAAKATGHAAKKVGEVGGDIVDGVGEALLRTVIVLIGGALIVFGIVKAAGGSASSVAAVATKVPVPV